MNTTTAAQTTKCGVFDPFVCEDEATVLVKFNSDDFTDARRCQRHAKMVAKRMVKSFGIFVTLEKIG